MTQTTMKGVWVTKTGRELKDLPVPTPRKHEVLIKNVAVASNPKDWKLPVYIPGYEQIEGNDVAGYIEEVGPEVTGFKKGDKVVLYLLLSVEADGIYDQVAAFTEMRNPLGGAYAEYSVAPDNTVFHLGPNTKFEDAAALPLAYMTAAIGLYRCLDLPTPDEPSSANPPIPILLWGASTTVGVYVTQLAKLSGLYVVGVAGAGCELAKSYGLDEVIDYRSKSPDELATAIQGSAGGRIKHVFDAVSEHGTEKAIALGLQPNGGKVAHVLPLDEKLLAGLPSNVQFIREFVGNAHAEDTEFARIWFAKAGEWLEKGVFRPQKIRIMERGLLGVEEGLRRLQANEVSGEKLVYIIADTPGLA